MTTAIIDADEILYTACKGCEQEVWFSNDWGILACDYDDVIQAIETKLDDIEASVEASGLVFALSDTTSNFRKDIAYDYKGNRKDTRKPLAYFRATTWLEDTFECYRFPHLEADDVMGLMANDVDVIVSSDKDMKTIPGVRLYSPYTGRFMGPMTEVESDYHWLYQTLVGDAVDGYKGCPSIGAKRAEKALDVHPHARWEVVERLFEKHGNGQEHALQQARLARILRPGEYANGRPLLWSPESSDL